MDVFSLRDSLIGDYRGYIESFIKIKDLAISETVQTRLESLWPNPLVQLNPNFERGESLEALAREGVLHPDCLRIFRIKDASGQGPLLSLHRHQSEAIRAGREPFVVTTGTGSGKSLTYIIPIVNQVLRQGSGGGVKAIVVYPMNALANSQRGELEKFLSLGFERPPVTFGRYTGQETRQEKEQILANPPDILLTNYVMLELILTRYEDRRLIERAKGLQFLVLDELHTYRGRQGADVALLVRRLRERLEAHDLTCIGTSATMGENAGTVAEVASRIFGMPVRKVIGETLRRVTQGEPVGLAERVKQAQTPSDFASFVRDPLAIWVEQTLGLREVDGRLRRQVPMPISGEKGVAAKLADETGVAVSQCEAALRECLMAGFRCTNPETLVPAFAFRLHQFIGRGDTVYASPEREHRHITLQPQQFAPGGRDRVLLPLAFCRECGQEFYTVWRDEGRFSPRPLSDRYSQPGRAGFLYLGDWPDSPEAQRERLPDEWLELSGAVRRGKQDKLPEPVRVNAKGELVGEGGVAAYYLDSPFQFCPHCGVAYPSRSRSDFGKLATLSSEGRSTATTILSLSSVLRLRGSDLPGEARKLLSFTDNRQDASLQAGHFNDFVEVSLLRSALYRAVADSPQGLSHEEITQQVFAALSLPFAEYSSNPEAQFGGVRREIERTLRDVLGHRIYRDLQRGWRITSPNLEQVDLLRIEYQDLEELCKAEEFWQGTHPALGGADPHKRLEVARVLLDLMRRELAIKVDYLDPEYLERLAQRSSQSLIEPWALDDGEKTFSYVLYPRPRSKRDSREGFFVGPLSSFGRYLRRPSLFGVNLSQDETQEIIRQLLQVLTRGGLVERVGEEGYQLSAASLIWKPGPGTEPRSDPLRVRSRAERKANRFFADFYAHTAAQLQGVEAAEHTAQVPSELREQREEDFRAGRLPVLYCSPTMELGVSISTLNVVSMRNVPPTPANYAQRSGRAGRSGQPALVFTYASTGNAHDQYFFRRPERMVAGVVSPPRLDLANEDLLRSHMYAVWLAETGVSLGHSLKDLLDIEGQDPRLDLLPSIRDGIHYKGAQDRALARCTQILRSLEQDLSQSAWYYPNWLEDTLRQAPLEFDRVCDRWRDLYRSAIQQVRTQERIASDMTRRSDWPAAERLRQEARAQLALLAGEGEEVMQSDFYSYRYFASEGFLPGYSFPRLPLSAFIPGKRGRKGRDDFLSRPRFLAVTEFGPHSTLYYEGNKYVIHKAILPPSTQEEVQTLLVKRCGNCGYLHPVGETGGPDLCERCRATLPPPLRSLLRMQNVATRRRERINSDEEERQRVGYEVLTGIRFTTVGGRPGVTTAELEAAGAAFASMSYAQAASIWRINLGWGHRQNRNLTGFLIDPERGEWIKDSKLDEEDTDEQNPRAARTQRVIPFVEDRKNSLLYEPADPLPLESMLSLLAALKNAVQVEYQLEDNELAAEILPGPDAPRALLLYEAAEGGAGVLRQLVSDPAAMGRLARTALELCHFDPDTGGDRRRARSASEDCVAACYDCLLNYSNQRSHSLLDRQLIRDYLLRLRGARLLASPTSQSRPQHLAALKARCDSKLEWDWLDFLEAHQLALPSRSQTLLEDCGTRPDFLYDEHNLAVYIDGPPHDYPERQARDQAREDCLTFEKGYTVIRFHHAEDWLAVVRQYPNIFGRLA